ncbi:MAG: DUF4433 domain-containing protein [Sedimentisphaerales bacterium]
MERSELRELHFITPISNVPSITEQGILSNIRARRMQHDSIAMSEIQARRARVRVPGGRRLHEYANLYICGRNPMLYKRLDRRDRLCVLAVSSEVLDLQGVIITDQNAGGDYVQFKAAPRGLSIVDRNLTFADDWRSPNQIIYWQQKAAKCAEVLVPDCVEPGFIQKVYVSCEKTRSQLEAMSLGIPVQIDRHLFFM